jgi:bile salt-stimulated lipase
MVHDISEFYFDGAPLSRAVRHQYTKYNTDLMFARGIDMTANIHAYNQKSNVFYYKFSVDQSLNLIKNLLLLQNYEGAVHADDIPYLFQITSVPAPLLPSNPAIATRRLMVRLWTNFAKTGNPTPPNDPIATVQWSPVEGNQQYYEIGARVFQGTNPHGERMYFWNSLKATLLNSTANSL